MMQLDSSPRSEHSDWDSSLGLMLTKRQNIDGSPGTHRRVAKSPYNRRVPARAQYAVLAGAQRTRCLVFHSWRRNVFHRFSYFSTAFMGMMAFFFQPEIR